MLPAVTLDELEQVDLGTVEQGERAPFRITDDRCADWAIRKIAEAIQSPGGQEAVNLKVAERAVDAFAQLAQKNNTMIVPGNMSEVSSLIATSMALIKNAQNQRPAA